MSKRHKKNVDETVNNEVIDETVEEGKETEEMNEKKSFVTGAKEVVTKIVGSTAFKVAGGVIIGVAATIGGKVLFDKATSDDGYEELDTFEDDFDASDEVTSEPAAEEN